MKKCLLILGMVLTGTLGYAQRVDLNDNALDVMVLSVELDGPAMTSMEMKQELGLTEEQYLEVARLNQSRYQQLQRAEDNFSNDPVLRSREFRSIQLKNDENLKHVLTAQQLRKYQKLEERMDLQLITENSEE